MKTHGWLVSIVLLVGSFHPMAAGYFFGQFMCNDGRTRCLNPASLMRSTLDALSPIKIETIVKNMVKQLLAVSTNVVEFAVDLGEDTINGFFNDTRYCCKGLTGKVTTCNELHMVKACLSTALGIWPGEKWRPKR